MSGPELRECPHDAWEQLHAFRRCADCGEYLPDETTRPQAPAMQVDGLVGEALTEDQIYQIGKSVADGCMFKNGSNNHTRVWLAAQQGARKAVKLLTALRPSQGWQPIETAPEAIEVIVSCADETMGHSFTTTATQELDGRWFNVGDGLLFPTHWQPLPTPPEKL